MNEINTADFSRIEILEIKNIEYAKEVFEDETAIYPCDVEWRPLGDTPYMGKAKQGVVRILSLLKTMITPGVYTLKTSNLYEKLVA